ncbi:hypothetical protein CFC21_091718 [Triticum aestivum]|nr:auxin response factor 5 [Aegilops tauschii subsp. strangulata]XP_044418631.1 auxin response factor 5-like [Triticum aestivum]KAF7088631.1 hypothetical protein CFC21_091718 [Triticum aestivum]
MPLTKVHKRGAISRSIDIGSFSGYGELNQALAHMFGMEGQLEDRQSIGWKCIYQDDEGDFLLLGDGPWEEFAIIVKSIWILSPQEVLQPMFPGGDLTSRL